MRKADYLRKLYNKIKKVNDVSLVYDIELPFEFKKKGDYEIPHCCPMTNEHGELIGIAVMHPYEYNEDIFTYSEYFQFVK